MGADPFWDRGSLSRVSGGSPALGVARFLAALGLGGWRRQGASAAQPRQARATVPEGGVAGPRPRRRRRFEEVVWGGRRPGFGDTDVAEKPTWTYSRRPGRGPPTPPPPRQPPAKAEGPTRHRHRDSHPQRRHHTATPKTPANAHESQRRHPPSQQSARKRATPS